MPGIELITMTHSPRDCQLRGPAYEAPVGRLVLDGVLWPEDLLKLTRHDDLCVHVVLPRDRDRWVGLFAGVRVLAERTAHVGVHAQPERGGFSIDPAVLSLSSERRRRAMLAEVIRDAGTAGVELTPSQVYVEAFSATRATLRLPAPAGRVSEWGVLCVAWFPLTPLFSSKPLILW
ncbi:hypothetical protein [Cryobacterium zongtaii]|uniref:hypothetical protein n=1 Tax=Cryobacterium zongtaii TaxID=1259217 RepID=UPI0013FDFCBD|nr:hypothetical protein [Cryobacterium zongtaii]